MARVLVAYASKRGGTQEIAEAIAKRLAKRGAAVDIVEAGRAHHLAEYDAIIVGSSLYGGHWRKSAIRALRRVAHLAVPPRLWLFHSGPLAELASDPQPLPARVFNLVQALGNPPVTTFGGRLAPEAHGFLAEAMVRNGKAGDWRDADAVAAFADGIADTLVPAF